MLMVCPNCHSDQVIAVQDQHFCINCGQVVPELPEATPKSAPAVQVNGLPAGVEILPLGSEAAPELGVEEVTLPDLPVADSSLIHARPRLALPSEPVTKKRKPGRPKSGRLDRPHTAVASTVPTSLPSAPQITPAVPATAGPRSMNDLARRSSAHANVPAKAERSEASETEPAPTQSHSPKSKIKSAKTHRPSAHRVGVAPLHYGPVIAFSLRARARPRLVGLAALGALALGASSAYGVWVLLNGGVSALAEHVMHSNSKLGAEAALLGVLYYIGRSLGHTAITYGIAREADQRPVSLSRQFGVAINTFGRRLTLDLGFGITEAALIAAGFGLFIAGGVSWPINASLQIGVVFAAYLALLYLLSALALSRGLAGVNLTLTTHKARTAARIGWQLFSHRIELIGPRFGAVLMEAVLAVPLIALGVALVVSAAPQYHPEVAIGAGLLAWLAGSLMGVGTAAWWALLYRQLVLADRPGAAVELLSARQPEDARRAPLAAIVALVTLVVAGTLLLPWINLG